MSSRGGRGGGGFGRGGSRGGGGAGGGRSNGGSEAKQRTAGRDATSIATLFNKNTRYDHRVAKEHKFWDKTKKLRSFHRLLKKEGVEPSGADAPSHSSSSSSSSSAPSSSSSSSSRVAPVYVSTAQLASSIANPDLIFSAHDPLAVVSAPRPKKKRPRQEREEAEVEAARLAEVAAAAASKSSSSKSKSKKPIAPPAPALIDASELKKRRLSADEFSLFQSQQSAARQNKQTYIAGQKEKRKEKFTIISERNERGQPVLAKQMEILLEKLQKQKALEMKTKADEAKRRKAEAAAKEM